MIEDMEGGKVLSQCMAAHPDDVRQGFREPRAAPASRPVGCRRSFRALPNRSKWQDELASQTRRLLIYPSMVMLVVFAVVIFLLVYLVPQVTRC